jgi:catechol 2,3-dioxygenase-like lactoylglutathione lyase family enzyme
MPKHIGYIELLVRDYDEAISYFIEKLGFTVAEDTDLGGGKRWVLVAPPGSATAGPHEVMEGSICEMLALASNLKRWPSPYYGAH